MGTSQTTFHTGGLTSQGHGTPCCTDLGHSMTAPAYAGELMTRMWGSMTPPTYTGELRTQGHGAPCRTASGCSMSTPTLGCSRTHTVHAIVTGLPSCPSAQQTEGAGKQPAQGRPQPKAHSTLRNRTGAAAPLPGTQQLVRRNPPSLTASRRPCPEVAKALCPLPHPSPTSYSQK